MTLDKNYVAKVGDVLSNPHHSLIIIEHVYELNRTSLRVNRNYNDHVFKHELLKRTISKREIIWDQHKFDYALFPERNSFNKTAGDNRKNTTFKTYLYYNDPQRYVRLYQSKYLKPPLRKHRVIIGKKAMVKVNHAFCTRCTRLIQFAPEPAPKRRPCRNYYGSHATPLNYLINNDFIYHGNIYNDYHIDND